MTKSISIATVSVLVGLLAVGCGTSRRSSSAIEVPLPKASEVTAETPFEIIISNDRSLSLNGEGTTLDALGDRLKALGATKDSEIVLKAELDAPYNIVANVLDRLKKAGHTRLHRTTMSEF